MQNGGFLKLGSGLGGVMTSQTSRFKVSNFESKAPAVVSLCTVGIVCIFRDRLYEARAYIRGTE